MKVVIFGAGASYDCIDLTRNERARIQQQWRPPLAKHLVQHRLNSFEDLLNKVEYRNAKDLAAEAQFESENIEEFLDKIYQKTVKDSNNIIRINQLHSFIFYLQELFMMVSQRYYQLGHVNYTPLLNKVNDYVIHTNQRVCFITFNYDTLFEKCLESFIKINSLDDYINGDIQLIKLHGSWNWHRLVYLRNDRYAIRKDATPLKEYFKNKRIGSNFVLGNKPKDFFIGNNLTEHVGHPEVDNQIYAYPSLSIPLTNKQEFNCPLSHISAAKDALKMADEILVIGWRASEKHMQKMLKECIDDREVKIIVINGTDENEAKKNIEETLPSVKVFEPKWGFSQYLEMLGYSDEHNIFKAN